MGQVIDFWTARELQSPPAQAIFCCRRCGADVWNILSNGTIRCADCEQECTLHATDPSGTDLHMTHGK